MGFPNLAKLIARDRDHETYVFRSFGQLATRTLLQLQSELAILEKEQERLDEHAEKLTTNRHVQIMLMRWRGFDTLDDEARNDYEVSQRVHLANKIAKKLERYYSLLSLQKQVASFEEPSARVMHAYRTLFYGPDGETPELYEPLESKALRSESHDYIALHPPVERDLLSQFMRDRLPANSATLYADNANQVKQYESRWLIRLATFCSVSIAALLLIASILLLYYVQTPNARLGLVLAFIVLFAVGVSVSTAATRDGIFASTAAYAAVLIVFVSGNLGVTNTGSLAGRIMGPDAVYNILINGTFG